MTSASLASLRNVNIVAFAIVERNGMLWYVSWMSNSSISEGFIVTFIVENLFVKANAQRGYLRSFYTFENDEKITATNVKPSQKGCSSVGDVAPMGFFVLRKS